MSNSDSTKIKKYLNSSNVHEKPQKTPESWYLPNRAGFLKSVSQNLGHLEIITHKISKDDIEIYDELVFFPHQKFIRDYLQYKSPYRGLLLYHSLGSGKTLTAVSTAELLLKNKDVIVLLPKYLTGNFIEEVKKYKNKYYNTKQYWEFISISTNATSQSYIDQISVSNRIDPKIIKKNKGIWLANNYKKSNYDNLNASQKNEIDIQINNIIENRYKFINLDGLRKKDIDNFKNNPEVFENKVIIIDEVHNFISQVINGGIALNLYKILLMTEKTKFICLSGTPIINYPREIAYLVNLLKGIDRIYTIALHKKKYSKTIEEEILQILKHNKIDYSLYDSLNKTIKIKFLPLGFVKTTNDKVKFDSNNTIIGYEQILANIINSIKALKINVNKTVKKHADFYPLPMDDQNFNNTFIDLSNLTIKNPKLFQRRILGAISYYTANDKNLYPTLNPTKVETLDFSDVQFNKYLEERKRERRSEKTTDLLSSKGKVYKAYSRAICNFAFPKTIKRPYPSDMKFITSELDTVDNNEPIEVKQAADKTKTSKDTEKAISKDLYASYIDKAVKDLEKGDYLNGDNLKDLSPKFFRLYENMLKTNGTILIYSQFRTVEGIKIISKVLDKRNFAEFKIKKDKDGNWTIDVKEVDINKPKYIVFESDQERNKILLKIFNSETNGIPNSIAKELPKYNTLNSNDANLHGSFIKVIMITRSGSEGISLKNVRQVHLMEPYWNQVRLDQVIGRAVRAKSHVNLPENERFVDVFLYLMKLNKERIEKNFTLRKQDKSLTTDEVIYEIATKKMIIINKLQKLIKEASVDCSIHNKNIIDIKCFNFPIDMDDKEIIVTANINENTKNANTLDKEKEVTLKLSAVKILKKLFIMEQDTGELFDYDLYKSFNQIKHIGYLKELKDTDQYELTIIRRYIKNVI